MEPDTSAGAGARVGAEAAAAPTRRRATAIALPRVDAQLREVLALAWRATWISRAIIWIAGVGSVLVWGLSKRAPGFDPAGLVRPFGGVGDVLIAPAARWDSVWYLAIAKAGYGDEHRAAFFPIYPLLVRAAGAVIGSPVVAGVLISTACFVIGLVAMHELTAMELGPDAARWTVIGLAFSPMSFFFSAVYTESLFLVLSVGSVLAARKGRWGWAGVLGALAAATRSSGIVLLVVLLGLAWVARPRPRLMDLAPLALVPAGLLGYMAALAAGGHDALAPLHSEAAWYRSFAGPYLGAWDGAVAAWDGVRQLLSGQSAHRYFAAAGGAPFPVARQNIMLFVFLLGAVGALAGAVGRLPRAYVLYVAAAIALPLSYPVTPEPLMSLPRYELALFPLWMWWGWWLSRHPRGRPPALVLSSIALAAFAAQFATWHWVA